MAKRINSGRKATPLELLDNSVQKKTAKQLAELKENQLTVKSASLKMPEDLSEGAKAEWKRIIDIYDGSNAKILNDLDIQAMRIYCEHTSLYNKAAAAMGNLPSILASTPESQRIINNITKTMNDSAKVIMSYSEQLCLTPIGRAKMGYASVRGSKKKKDAEPETVESKRAQQSMRDFMSNRRSLV